MWMRPPSPIVQTPSSNIHLQKMPDHELREIKASDGQAPNIRTQLKHTDDRSWGKGNSPFAGSTSQQSPDLVTPRLDWGSNIYTRKHVHPVNFTGTVENHDFRSTERKAFWMQGSDPCFLDSTQGCFSLISLGQTLNQSFNGTVREPRKKARGLEILGMFLSSGTSY